MKHSRIPIALTLCVLGACTTAITPPSPGVLTVNEGRVDPLGFHDATPTFSWQLDDERQGAAQTAYQIQVTDADNNAIVWDTGKVDSSQSVYVPYEGPELSSRQRVDWRVRYWDHEGKGSDWSAPAVIEFGLLENPGWQGSWIHVEKAGFEPVEKLGNPVVYLRKSFTLDAVPDAARLYLTAKGIVDFRINGTLVTPDAFVPGFTDYTQKIETLTYDVGSLLQEGENVLAARIADGWYSGQISDRIYGLMPELLAQLELKAADGSVTRTIATDESWQYSTDGPVTMADIWHGEDYDANRELQGWDQAGYEGAFEPVAVTELDPAVSLSPKRFQTVRHTDTLTPVSHEVLPDGSVVFDLGQNMVGWFSIRLPVLQGQAVSVRVAEMLNENGTLYRDNYRSARAMAVYTPAADGIAEYTPTFTFFGFRYVEVSGYDSAAAPEPDWVEGKVLHTDFRRTGRFESSHAKLNKLYSNIIWGQRGNFLDIPTDCPQRDERYGWTGDAQVFAPISLFNYDTHAFWMSYLESMHMEMTPDGGVPHVIPSSRLRGRMNSAGWADAAFVIPWELYRQTGDLEVLREFYPMMVKRVAYYANKAEGGLVDEPDSFGDWLQPRPYGTEEISRGGRGGETSTRLLATSYFGYGAALSARAAEALGLDEEAAEHWALFQEVAAAVADDFFDDEGRVVEGIETQTAYVLPLAFGLIDGELAAKAVTQLSARIEKDGNLLNTGFLGTAVLIPTLEKFGLREQALQMLFTSEYPSWFYSIDQGATTMWERWNSYTKEDGFGDARMNSFNHYAYGAVGSFFHEHLAGLATSESAPGYAEIVIAPVLDERVPLDHASAELDTRYGRASNAWSRTDAGWQMDTVIPPNTTGRIALAVGPDSIDVTAGEVTFVAEGGGAVARVAAGRYGFVIRK